MFSLMMCDHDVRFSVHYCNCSSCKSIGDMNPFHSFCLNIFFNFSTFWPEIDGNPEMSGTPIHTSSELVFRHLTRFRPSTGFFPTVHCIPLNSYLGSLTGDFSIDFRLRLLGDCLWLRWLWWSLNFLLLPKWYLFRMLNIYCWVRIGLKR